MYSEQINNLSAVAVKKDNALKNSKSKYLVASALAGMFVGLGIVFIFTIGGILNAANSPETKIMMGAAFGVALSLVMMCGSELFTGNNLVMTVGALEKTVTWKSAINIWIYSFIGNFIGALVLASLYVGSGLAKYPATSEFILKSAGTKMSAPFIEIFIRGILCNILVCLAVWCFFKLKEEVAKLIMIFWCLFAFITTGYEHSVANMTLLSVALMIPHKDPVNFIGLLNNITASTLGNLVGGAVFVGAAYWYISKPKK